MTDHAKAAHENLDALHDWQEREGESDTSMLTVTIEAQVHATLALVEEQRTANQLAWLIYRGQGGTIPFGEPGAADLAARLALTPTTPNQEQNR